MIKEWREDPVIARAVNKDKLCRNIITIGSTGDQQYLNMVAFQQALDIYNQEIQKRDQERLQNDLKKAIQDADKYRELYEEQIGDIRDLNEQLRSSQRETIALMAPSARGGRNLISPSPHPTLLSGAG
ncbi:hypothetical protein GBAR_LOCUS16101 [Geodia barretti]|uniref:Uncharacterized protein n=1 Tax=Geodia barretti TaxID=519541 RepID=A0AA35SFH8_GEOBA|nr:hypothetical protein GBAR_LOCUS16101 [Geodia barretti]